MPAFEHRYADVEAFLNQETANRAFINDRPFRIFGNLNANGHRPKAGELSAVRCRGRRQRALIDASCLTFIRTPLLQTSSSQPLILTSSIPRLILRPPIVPATIFSPTARRCASNHAVSHHRHPGQQIRHGEQLSSMDGTFFPRRRYAGWNSSGSDGWLRRRRHTAVGNSVRRRSDKSGKRGRTADYGEG